ncbi:MAG: hypothetical protein H7Y36_09615, partial [Armatimonadetes bacterium]|nr:hypothetical protein [Akkermansiaceae bacterium]
MDTEANPEFLNRQPKWFKPVFYGLIISSALFAIILLATPLLVRRREPHYQTEAYNNARQIGLALSEFDDEFGSFPNPSTIAKVTTSNPSHSLNLSGASSNAAFRQFFAAYMTQSESMFYAKITGTIKPDGIFTPGEALKKTEVGFSYISGLSSTGTDPSTPLVLTPLLPGTT